jgi:O-antigen/teichoic acid export membrane protein
LNELENEKDIEGISSLKTLVKGAGILLLGLVLSKFITYFTRIFIARYFGPEEYGLFSLGLAVISFASVFTLLGLPSGVTRYISYFRSQNEDAKVKGVLIFSLWFVALTSIILGGVIFLISPQIAELVFHNQEFKTLLRVFAISIPFASLTSILSSSYVGFKEIKYRVYTERIILNLLKLGLIVLFGVLGYGVLGLAFAYTLATVITFLVALYFLEKKLLSLRSSIYPEFIKRELLFFSLPLMASSFVKTVVTRIDIIMIGYFITATDVGIYNVAVPTAQLLTIFTASMSALFLPILSELYAKKRKNDLALVYKTVVKWTFYLNYPLLLMMVFFPTQIINLLFGAEYASGALPLSILSIGLFMGTLFFAPTTLTIMAKKTRIIFSISTVLMVVNILLNLSMIPRFGINGAAAATTITFIFNAVLIIGYSWRNIGISPFSKGLVKSVPIGLFSMLIVYTSEKFIFDSIDGPLFILIIIPFLIIYAVSLLIFNELQREDIEILKVIEKKSKIKSQILRNLFRRFRK